MRPPKGQRFFPVGDAWHWGGVETAFKDLQFEDRLARLAHRAAWLRRHAFPPTLSHHPATPFNNPVSVTPPRPRRYAPGMTCHREGCAAPVHAHRQCYNHYMSEYKNLRRSVVKAQHEEDQRILVLIQG